MSNFKSRLRDLDDDELDDAAAAVNRERARRSQRPVAEMTDPEYRAWADAQIRSAEEAKARAAKEQQDDGTE
jgi:hypothetical protein